MGPSGFEGVKRPEAQHERLEAVRVWLLGGFRVSVGSRTIEGDAWRLRKAAALVKLLALAPDHRLHREQVMDLLWPDLATKAASNNLRQTLHGARRTLTSDPGVGFPLLGIRRRVARAMSGRHHCGWTSRPSRKPLRPPAAPETRCLPGCHRALRRRTLAGGPLRGVGRGQARGAAAHLPLFAHRACPALRGACGVRDRHRDATEGRIGRAHQRGGARWADAPLRSLRADQEKPSRSTNGSGRPSPGQLGTQSPAQRPSGYART